MKIHDWEYNNDYNVWYKVVCTTQNGQRSASYYLTASIYSCQKGYQSFIDKSSYWGDELRQCEHHSLELAKEWCDTVLQEYANKGI